jgi:hypothetical protein
MWPLIPFNWNALKNILIRYPINSQNSRHGILLPIDKDRRPEGYMPVPSRKPTFKGRWRRDALEESLSDQSKASNPKGRW